MPKNPLLFTYQVGSRIPHTKVTLRDLFAGMAMQGLVSHERAMGTLFREDKDGAWKSIAHGAYTLANEMLKARELGAADA